MKVLTVVGARPQFIKAAPLTHALTSARIHEVLVHTGQHFDEAMSDVFFQELSIPPPKHNLHVGGMSHGAMTGRMLESLEKVLWEEKPDWVLVYGDTNSTLAGALAASKLHIPVAHIEAGLRSFNRRMPEEVNRVLTDHISAALFCPTDTAVANLEREGIIQGVHCVGDVMYDGTIAATRMASARSQILHSLDLRERSYAVATLHRAENTDDPQRLREILEWIEEQAKSQPIIMPLHPRTRNRMEGLGLMLADVKCISPLGYLDMTQLVSNAAAIFTDSGGLQKESYFHRVPCVTLRDETEWVETIEAGWNRLWTNPEYQPRKEITQYGDGHSADRIAGILSSAGAGG